MNELVELIVKVGFAHADTEDDGGRQEDRA